MSSGLQSTPIPRPEQLLSLDALRGFDMFWIIGGEYVVQSLSRHSNGTFSLYPVPK